MPLGRATHRILRGEFGRLILGVAFLLLVLGLFLAVSGNGAPAITQPIQFNHRVHTKKEPCTTCHKFVNTREVAGRPDMDVCMECHTNAVTDSAEEEKVRLLAEAGSEIAWRRLTRVPPHVRFSHSRHVSVGGVGCEDCHGAIALSDAPPPKPLVEINMGLCLDCHRSRGFRLSGRSLEILSAENLEAPVLEALESLRDRRFGSESQFFSKVESLVKHPLPKEQRERIFVRTNPSKKVTTDCLACHR